MEPYTISSDTMIRDLEIARRKFKSGIRMTHKECMLMYFTKEISCKQLCECDSSLAERWHQYLKLTGKNLPGTDLDADNFIRFMNEWMDDPAGDDTYFDEKFDMAKMYGEYLEILENRAKEHAAPNYEDNSSLKIYI